MANKMLILRIGHVTAETAVDLAQYTHQDLKKQWRDVVTLPIYSDTDVVATFARVIPFDLIIIALDLQDRLTGQSPLVGETFLIEAKDLIEHSFPALQKMLHDEATLTQTGNDFHIEACHTQTIAPLDSLQVVLKTGNPQYPNAITEAATLLRHMHDVAQKAVGQERSLVLRYEWGLAPRKSIKRVKEKLREPAKSAQEKPTPILDSVRWGQTQKRPLLLALLFGFVFSLMSIANGFVQSYMIDVLQVYSLSMLGFLTPLWLVQGWLMSKGVHWRMDGEGTAVWFGLSSFRFYLFGYQFHAVKTSHVWLLWGCVTFGFLMLLWFIPLYTLYPALAYWFFPAWFTSLLLALTSQQQ